MLVTRPEPGAAATAARLSVLGHRPLLLPLSELRALPARLPPADEVDAIAITSASALRFLDPAALPPLLRKPCFCVGERTAEAARHAGFRYVGAGGGDGAALAALIADSVPAGALVLHPCGRPRRPEPGRSLAAAGIRSAEAEVYEAVFLPVDAAGIARAAGDGPVDFALVHSPEAARALSRAVAVPGVAGIFEMTCFLCLSRQVAAALAGLPAGRIRWSEQPDEASLLALLPPA